MTTLKILFVFFIWTNYSICTSNIISEKLTLEKLLNIDTTYFASTKELKSNKIPDSVFQMTKLQHLAICGMDCDYGDHKNCWTINELPKQIRNLKELKTLRLTINSISKIPKEITELKKITLIDFTDNAGFENIEELTKLSSLEYLYLYVCSLSKLPEKIGDLKNLKELGLVGNNLEESEKARIKKELPNCIIKF
jgi:Leucine-rich repeat (LRR) protein